MSFLQRLPFWAALPIFAAGMVAGVYGSIRTHDLLWLLVAVVVVGALAGVYLFEYSRLPMLPPTPPRPRPTPAVSPTSSTGSEAPPSGPSAPTAPAVPLDPVDLEPDYDPVEEADQLESEKPGSPSG